MTSLLGFCCGILATLGFIVALLVNLWLKFLKSFDGRYLDKSWLTIWRAERALKRKDVAEYERLIWGKRP